MIVCLHLLYNCRNALFDPLLYVCRFIVLCAPYDNKLSDKVTEPNENDERVQEVDKPPDPAVHVTQRTQIHDARQREDVGEATERAGEPTDKQHTA